MRRPAWFRRGRPRSWWARVVLSPLVPLSWVYGGFARLHRIVHERRFRRPARLGCRVIAVGNLVVGGSGKTPTAAWIARGLRERGHQAVLASRGYGRLGRRRVEVVSDGRHVRSTVDAAGDEPWLLAKMAPGVPVLVGPHRDVVGLRAVSAFGAQVLVLDDGFQHHRLARDVDVVLVDAQGGFGNGFVLPRGPLREPASALARADAVGIVTAAATGETGGHVVPLADSDEAPRADSDEAPLADSDEAPLADGRSLADADARLLERHAPAARRFVVRRGPVGVRALEGGAMAPAASLSGCKVGVLSAIASPESLRAALEAIGAEVVAERALPDHHRYRESDLRGLDPEVGCWVTTEKDAVKILPRWTRGLDLRVLVERVEVEDGAALLDWLEGRLRARPRGRDATLPAR